MVTFCLPEVAVPERKVPVVTLPTHTVYLERTSGLTFGHCDLHVPYTKQVREKLIASWNALRALHTEPIYALHTPGDRKHEKWLAMFGFEFLAAFNAPDDTPTELYVNP